MRAIILIILVGLNGCASWKIQSKDSSNTIWTRGSTETRVCHGESGTDDCTYITKIGDNLIRMCEPRKPCEEMTGEKFLSHFF